MTAVWGGVGGGGAWVVDVVELVDVDVVDVEVVDVADVVAVLEVVVVAAVGAGRAVEPIAGPANPARPMSAPPIMVTGWRSDRMSNLSKSRRTGGMWCGKISRLLEGQATPSGLQVWWSAGKPPQGPQ